MKRLNFVLNEAGYCKVQVNDLNGLRCFFMDSEKEEKAFEIDIFGDSFDLTVTPLVPDSVPKDNNNITFKEKIENKLISAVENAVKDIFFRVECTYHIENFSEGDTVNINMLIYGYPTNDDEHPLWWLSPEFLDMVFPVGYMFYDVLLNSKRIEPKSTACIDRKKQ